MRDAGWGAREFDEVAAEHGRGEPAVEVAWRADLELFVFEGVVPHGSAVGATSVTGVSVGGRAIGGCIVGKRACFDRRNGTRGFCSGLVDGGAEFERGGSGGYGVVWCTVNGGCS